MVTSQWIDPRYKVSASDDEITIDGALQRMTSTTSFTPMKMAAFRAVLSTVGRSARASHAIKGAIRRTLMLGTRAVPLAFRRQIKFAGDLIVVVDEVRRTADVVVIGLMVGDEFAVRYVPQSRFFQFPDLAARGYALSHAELIAFRATGRVRVRRSMDIVTGQVTMQVNDAPPIVLIEAHQEPVPGLPWSQ